MNPTTRAIVLARGLGTRMREREAAAGAALDAAQASAADAGLKAMIPFGRPFLDHVLHSLAQSGFRQVALVLGPEHERIREYYRGLQTTRIEISFLTQPEPLGTADAVCAAEAWTSGEPFVTLNADNLYPVPVLARLSAGAGPAVPGFERDSLRLPLSRVGAFALLERDARGCLSGILEKPGEQVMAAAGAAALISTNLWRFDHRIFGPCRDVPVSARGERELPLAVGLAASRGICFEVVPVSGAVLDLSRRSDVAGVARALEGARVEL
jgi:glucose-1-phosphate thymidylyltransferase